MPRCWHCKAETPAAHWERVVENRTALYADWEGWRLSGRFLIAPGKAGRIMPARLLGILWAEQAAARKRKTVAQVGATVFRLPTRQA